MRGHPEPAPDRWAARYVVRKDGCWEWTGATNEKGYGTFNTTGGRKMYAHRFGYELIIGPIPPDLELDHQCHTDSPDCPGGPCLHRRCVNPSHLTPVTHAENLRRGKSATKVECVNGHALDDANVYRRPDTGSRQCRRCAHERYLARNTLGCPAIPPGSEPNSPRSRSADERNHL